MHHARQCSVLRSVAGTAKRFAYLQAMRHMHRTLLFLLMLPSNEGRAQGICIDFLDNGWSGGAQPRGVVAAHLNGDTLLDVALSNYETDNVSICFGNGDATFQPALNLSVSNAPTDIVAADFDDDGLIDLATSNTGVGVSVLLNTGGGTFASAVTYAISSAEIWTLMARDLDGDQVLDLIVPHGSAVATITVLHGNGDGTFFTGNSANTGVVPISLDMEDLNGDGHLDVVFTHIPGWSEIIPFISVLWGTGPGAFGSVTEFTHPYTTLDAIIYDIDGDDDVDILTADFINGTITKFIGHDDGTFDPPVTFPAYLGPSSLQLHDMDLDGILDLVTSDYDNNSVVVQLGDGLGNYGTAVNATAAVNPEDFAVGRFNADAYPDVILGSTYSGIYNFGIVVNCLVAGIANGDGLGPTSVYYDAHNGVVRFTLGEGSPAFSAMIVDAAGREAWHSNGPLIRSGALHPGPLASGFYVLWLMEAQGKNSRHLPFVVP